MDTKNAKNVQRLEPRRSKCATRSRELEQERVSGLTVEARIGSALTMNSRFCWLKPVPRET